MLCAQQSRNERRFLPSKAKTRSSNETLFILPVRRQLTTRWRRGATDRLRAGLTRLRAQFFVPAALSKKNRFSPDYKSLSVQRVCVVSAGFSTPSHSIIIKSARLCARRAGSFLRQMLGPCITVSDGFVTESVGTTFAVNVSLLLV